MKTTTENTKNETAAKSSSKPSSDTLKIFEMYESIKQKETTVKDEEAAKKLEAEEKEKQELAAKLFEHFDEAVKSSSTTKLDKSESTEENLNRAASNLSIASTLTNSSSSKNPAASKSEAVNDVPAPEWVRDGAVVIVSTNSVMNKRGVVRFVGETHFQPGTWVGVELDQSSGKNDGSVKGHRYFKCPDNRGVFVRADKLTLVNNNNSTS